MKRKLIICSAFGLVALAAITAWLVDSSRVPTRITLSFAGYTNDAQGLRSRLYQISDQSDRSMALFDLVNHTSRSFWCSPQRLQIKTGDQWTDDTNWVGYASTGATLAGKSAQALRLAFPVPTGSNTWRCSVELLDITYDIGPLWRTLIIGVLRQVGVGFQNKDSSLWSPEITR